MGNKSVFVIGPTAVGKTSLGVKLANKFNGEIISIDSRQVYCGLDIGTGKDLSEYFINGVNIPHHLIDIISPAEEFNLFLFVKEFNKSFDNIVRKQKLPIAVGGTGLFLHAIFKRYRLNRAEFNSEKTEALKKLSVEKLKERLLSVSNDLHNTTDLIDKERIIRAILIAESEATDFIEPYETNSVNICILPERSVIHKRIEKRLKKRLNEGMIEEAQALIASGISHARLQQLGLEYRYLSLYLQGKINRNDMYQKLASAIKKFAKRQITWIRKFEKEGVKIHYLESPDLEKAEKIIESEIQFR